MCQHLADDGLDSKRNLECNATGYRPAYSLDEIISKEGAVSELAKLLKSRNLHILGMKINSVLGIKLSLPVLAFLGDFYFDVRHSGDNFVTVTPEISVQCREIMENVLVTLQPFVKSTGTSEMKSF